MFEEYKAQVYRECVNLAKNDTQIKNFDDWWNGKQRWSWDEKANKYVRAPEYESYSDEDWDAANELIRKACYAGCG